MTALPRATLTGDGVVLRMPRESDADDVAAACNDETTARYLWNLPVPYGRDDALAWIGTMVPSSWEADGATFVIADPATDRLIGSIGTPGSRRSSFETSLGYWVAPWARGRGVATDATKTLARWLFEQGFGRIELHTDTENEASQRVALASGFRHEAIRRDGRATRDGGRRDSVIWTRLARDPDKPTTRVLPDLPADGLTDGVITLHRLGPADADDLHALHTTPDVAIRSVRPMPTRAETAERCALVGYHWLIGARAELAIRDAATGAFAGDLGLFGVQLEQGMIGYSLNPEWRGRAYATRAARLITGWCFDQVGLVRVVAGTAPDNVASQRTLEKAGFHREGYERRRLPGPDGTRIDNVAFAIIKSDRL
jgi:RimJ/RimL family protein N-acetyltransferase